MDNNEFCISPERLFKDKGPFFHVCSKPVDAILFSNDQDKKAALVYLSIAAGDTAATILAYAIMSNHFHTVISGNNPERFYQRFGELVNHYLARHGHVGYALSIEPTIVPITTLSQLMDEIAYVIRNQYVVDKSVNPLSHIWCSGYLYFNPITDMLMRGLRYTPVSSLSARKRFLLTYSRNYIQCPDYLKVVDGFPAPSSFVDYRLVEKLYSNSRQFITRVFKSVEGQIESARLLGETPVLPDEEMAREMWKYCISEWGIKGMRSLTRSQRLDLAKHMKYSYHSSNGQIARITLLTRKDVDTLFPQ